MTMCNETTTNVSVHALKLRQYAVEALKAIKGAKRAHREALRALDQVEANLQEVLK